MSSTNTSPEPAPPGRVVLRPLTEADARAVRDWPLYPPEVEALDYALRPGGWLDQFPEAADTQRFAAWDGPELVGFSILTHVAGGEAEFYVALRPDRIGRGVGRALTEQTLAAGFGGLGLKRIYLKVRPWHRRAAALYEKLGFRRTGRAVEEVQGRPVEFDLMEVGPADRRPPG